MKYFSCNGCLLSSMFLACLVVFSIAASPLAAEDAPAAAQGEQPLLTNFQVLERISREAALEIAVRLGEVPAGSAIALVRSKGIGDEDFIVENALVKMLTERGYAVSLDKAARDSTAAPLSYRLVYQIIRMPLWYQRIGRRFVFGPRYVNRAAKLDLFYEFVRTESGGIVWAGDTSKGYRDRISYGDLKTVEEGQYDFTRPPRGGVRWSRFVEPVVVGGIISGLVYLFFSNQSNE